MDIISMNKNPLMLWIIFKVYGDLTKNVTMANLETWQIPWAQVKGLWLEVAEAQGEASTWKMAQTPGRWGAGSCHQPTTHLTSLSCRYNDLMLAVMPRVRFSGRHAGEEMGPNLVGTKGLHCHKLPNSQDNKGIGLETIWPFIWMKLSTVLLTHQKPMAHRTCPSNVSWHCEGQSLRKGDPSEPSLLS